MKAELKIPPPTTLHHRISVSIAWRTAIPSDNESTIGTSSGGPETILNWLETQLGLQRKSVSSASRTLQYAARLKKAELKVCAESFALDAWGTAANLLQRRDDLLLWGWDGKDDKRLPALARDLAVAEAVEEVLAPGTPERLAAILKALDDEQKLPPHQFILHESPSVWPKAWRALLGRLNITEEQFAMTPAAGKRTALRSIQERLCGNTNNTKPDKTLAWWHAASDTAAVDTVAAFIAALGADAAKTAVLCEDTVLAALLDDRLRRRGVPAIGCSVRSSSHPILQILPLSIGLIWDPVDPALLLDLLTLPKSPFGSAAEELAEAVAEQPGIGGELWNGVINGLKENGKTKALDTIPHWLPVAGATREKPLTPDVVMRRCGQVARWARGLCASLSKSSPQDPLIPALEQLAGQSATLSELAEATPAPLTEAHLGRLVTAAQEGGASLVERFPEAGGPTLLRGLANLPEHCERLIWLGITGGQHAISPWTVAEREALRSCGIDTDSEEVARSAERKAERAAVCRLKNGLLAIELAAHSDTDAHPIWIEASAGLPYDAWQSLELNLASPPKDWPTPSAIHEPAPVVRPDPVWHVAPGSIHDVDTSSYSEIETRLGCPLKWTFDYAAHLNSSRVASIPPEFRLLGTVAHKVLELTFGGRTTPSSAGEAERMAVAAFHTLLSTEAAPLALPSAARARQRFESELGRAASEFHNMLTRGGYHVLGFEFEPGGKLDGRDFKGRPDCVLEDTDRNKAIVDLKFFSSNYRDYIEDGTTVQLAVYAAAVAGDGKGGVLKKTAVAYFIIKFARLLTPSNSPIKGTDPDETVPGPSVADTWSRIAEALSVTTTWLKSGEIPARPLQDKSQWPPGAEIALSQNKYKKDFGLCVYCNHPVLCGKKEIE